MAKSDVFPARRPLAMVRRPPPKFIDLVGLAISEQGRGSSTCTLEVAAHHLNSSGLAHGGALFTLADTGMGAALIPLLNEGERCATIEVKINYFRPVTKGTIVCTTEVVHRGRSIANLESVLRVEDELVAKANGSYAITTVRTKKAT